MPGPTLRRTSSNHGSDDCLAERECRTQEVDAPLYELDDSQLDEYKPLHMAMADFQAFNDALYARRLALSEIHASQRTDASSAILMSSPRKNVLYILSLGLLYKSHQIYKMTMEVFHGLSRAHLEAKPPLGLRRHCRQQTKQKRRRNRSKLRKARSASLASRQKRNRLFHGNPPPPP